MDKQQKQKPTLGKILMSVYRQLVREVEQKKIDIIREERPIKDYLNYSDADKISLCVHQVGGRIMPDRNGKGCECALFSSAEYVKGKSANDDNGPVRMHLREFFGELPVDKIKLLNALEQIMLQDPNYAEANEYGPASHIRISFSDTKKNPGVLNSIVVRDLVYYNKVGDLTELDMAVNLEKDFLDMTEQEINDVIVDTICDMTKNEIIKKVPKSKLAPLKPARLKAEYEQMTPFERYLVANGYASNPKEAAYEALRVSERHGTPDNIATYRERVRRYEQSDDKLTFDKLSTFERYLVINGKASSCKEARAKNTNNL